MEKWRPTCNIQLYKEAGLADLSRSSLSAVNIQGVFSAHTIHMHTGTRERLCHLSSESLTGKA